MWEILTAWAVGEPVRDRFLWGLQVYWWGRLGMVLSAGSALVLVAELVGRDRFLAFASSIRASKTAREPKWRYSFSGCRLVRGSWLELLLLPAKVVFTMILLFGILVWLALGISPWEFLEEFSSVGLRLSLAGVCFVVALLIVAFTGALIVDSVLLLVRAPLLLVGHVLSLRSLMAYIKAGSLLLLLIGLFFDLLAA